MPIRINKYLAGCGVASRRTIDKLIAEKRIAINGVVLQKPGSLVEEGDSVTVDGKQIEGQSKNGITILLNKPTGCITTSSDPQKRKTVLDYVQCGVRVFPIGRLDKDTTGVLLLTNDGELAHMLMHPRYSVEKIYQAHLDKPFIEAHKKRFESGVVLDDKKTTPCHTRFVGNSERNVVITLHEGRNRQIHRMFKSLGYVVEKLERTSYASLTTHELKQGEWRYLTRKEVERLYGKC